MFGDMTLGDAKIKTGLCIVAKRADTNSVWPLINHPKGKFYDSVAGRNKDIMLWKAVRASAAAPTYFLPQVIDVGGDLPKAAFVDGGVSMANNPALQLLMVATLKGFPFQWKKGADNIMLTSVGTGMSRAHKLPENISKNNLLKWAQDIPDMLMQDASWQNQMILQWLSNSPTRWHIDMEIGDMKGDLLSDKEHQDGLLHYLRYNTLLEVNHLNELKAKGKTYNQQQVEDLIEMSNAASRFDLYDIGFAAGQKEIREEHFPEHFIVEEESAALPA
jgi:patatin-like phospholipase/acyl hydrolase